jgi:hypothetical protein
MDPAITSAVTIATENLEEGARTPVEVRIETLV